MRTQDQKAVIVLGGAGVGKTTLLRNLAIRGVPLQHIGMSGLLKAASEDQAFCPRMREQITLAMNECRLVDDEISITVFLRNFFANGFLMEDLHQFFDGATRTKRQVEQILSALKSRYSTGGVTVIDLVSPPEVRFQRLFDRKRPGENEEGIRRRLEIDKRESSGVIQALVSAGLTCHTINTNQDEAQTLEEALGVCYRIGLS